MFIKAGDGTILNMNKVKIVKAYNTTNDIFVVMKDDTQFRIADCFNENTTQLQEALAGAIEQDEKMFDVSKWLSENTEPDSVWRRRKIREKNKEKSATKYITPFCGVQEVASVDEAYSVMRALCDMCQKEGCNKDNSDCNNISGQIWTEWIYPHLQGK